MDKIAICDDLGCAFRWNEEFQRLEECPILSDGTLDIREWWYPEESNDEETVTYKGKVVPLNSVLKEVEQTLGIAKKEAA